MKRSVLSVITENCICPSDTAKLSCCVIETHTTVQRSPIDFAHHAAQTAAGFFDLIQFCGVDPETPGFQSGPVFHSQRIRSSLAHEQITLCQRNAIAGEGIFLCLIEIDHSALINSGYGQRYGAIGKRCRVQNAGAAGQNRHDHVRMVLAALQIELQGSAQIESFLHGR